MKTLNLFIQEGNERSFNRFSSFTISNKKMNFIRGGGHPILPSPGDLGEWIEDDDQP